MGLMVVIGLALMASQLLIQKWDKTAIYRVFVQRSTTAKIDVVIVLLQLLGLSTLLEIAFSFGLTIVAARLTGFLYNQLNWARITLPSDGVFEIAFSVLVYWVVQNFVAYWVHRVYHLPIFWNLHRFHHAAPELNFITMMRFHPGEPILRIIFFASPLLLLQTPDIVLLIALIISHIINFVQHSELDWDWGWIGRWIFGSPHVHQVHHSLDEEHRDTNFCACPLWDHVFGTWYAGDKKPSAYGVTVNGVPDYGYDREPVKQFARDTLAFYRELGAWLLQPIRKVISLTRKSSGDDVPTRLDAPR
jgi:sterol desaturase/sphingolipid hydroxylase (fatty acid hydroxylase superfamily)